MSFRSIFENLPKEEVQRYLEENADAVQEDYTYMRRLTEEELQDLSTELGENSVSLAILNDRKREFMEKLKLETQPLSSRNKEITESLRSKTQEVTGPVYEFKDIENGVVETFTAEGEFLGSRRLRPDEGQGTIYSMRNRTGTFGE